MYGEVSTGAQDNLRKATDIAKSIVVVYGMSEKLGQVSLERDRIPCFFRPVRRSRQTTASRPRGHR